MNAFKSFDGAVLGCDARTLRMPKYPGKTLDEGADHSDMKGKPRAYFDTVDWPARFPQRWKRALWRSGGDEAKTRERLADIQYGMYGDVPESEQLAPVPVDATRRQAIIRSGLAAFGWDERKFCRGEYRRGCTKRMAHYHWRGMQQAAG